MYTGFMCKGICTNNSFVRLYGNTGDFGYETAASHDLFSMYLGISMKNIMPRP